jgi:hypothetical protein
VSADARQAPALHGRAHVLVTVRGGSALPVAGARVGLHVESGPGVLLGERALVTGYGGTAVGTLASPRKGAVVVSASVEGAEGPIPCGSLELTFFSAPAVAGQRDPGLR